MTENTRGARSGRLRTALAFLWMVVTVERWRAAGAVALSTALGLMTGVGMLLLIALLPLVGFGADRGVLNQIAVLLQTAFHAVNVQPTFLTVLAAFVLLTAFSASLIRLQTVLCHRIAFNLVASCRRRLFEAIGQTQWIFFARSRSSDYTHALVTECDRVGSLAYFLVSLMSTSFISAVYLAVAIRVSWPITLLVGGCGAGLVWTLRRYRRRASEAGTRSSEIHRALYSAITDYVVGMKTMRIFGAEGRHVDAFSRLTGQLRDLADGAGRHHANARFAFDIGTVITLVVVVYVAIAVRHLQPPEVLLLLFLFARIMPQAAALEQTCRMILEQLPAVSAILDMERRCRAAAEPRPAIAGMVAFGRTIDLRHVSFGYDVEPVVENVQMTIRAGETTALVGSSGAGKSTIADLIIGLLVPDEGAVLVDGIALSPALMSSWREQVGYVPQDAFLFHDTVRANLLWARPEATADELWEALRLAAADEFVEGLPQGLDTIVGDRGVLVSGGERQRLALARAILRRPALLILDEATSSLDYENERRIHGAIERLHGRITIVIITHRLAAIRTADMIHVIERGRLVESGTWADLMAAPISRLRELNEAQDAEPAAPAFRGGALPADIAV